MGCWSIIIMIVAIAVAAATATTTFGQVLDLRLELLDLGMLSFNEGCDCDVNGGLADKDWHIAMRGWTSNCAIEHGPNVGVRAGANAIEPR